jgi:hypothetical protein
MPHHVLHDHGNYGRWRCVSLHFQRHACVQSMEISRYDLYDTTNVVQFSDIVHGRKQLELLLPQQRWIYRPHFWNFLCSYESVFLHGLPGSL